MHGPPAGPRARDDDDAIVELVAVEPDEHLPLRIVGPLALRAFGPVVVTYAVHPDGPEALSGARAPR